MHPSDDVVAAFRAAVETRDVDALRALGAAHDPSAWIDRPLFAFDAPALVYAAHVGNRAVLDALLDLGADPDARSAWAPGPYTALTHLLDAGGPEAIALGEHLVARGATVDLHAAAGLGRLDRLGELLDADPDRIDEPGPDGAAPLHLAADPTVAAFLLDRGADIDRRCVDHRSTPVMWAIAKRPEVSRFLVSRGARPDLFLAAALGDVDLARDVLADDPDAVELRLRPGRPLAHLGGGDKYVWSLDFADTALEVARRRGHDAVYRFLLERASPPAQAIQASRRGDLPALESLLDDHPRLLDDAPAHAVAALLDAPAPAIRLLAARGADLDALDDDAGATALHAAAWKGDLDRVRALVEAGADPNLHDRTHGSTPLGWADYAGHASVAAYLRSRTGSGRG